MKHNWIYLLIFSLFFTVIYTTIFDTKLDLNGDNAHYLNLAKNISSGLGYANITPDGATPASHFPPGYPAFLSVFMSFGINSLVFFKALNGLLFFVSLLGIFYLIHKITDNQILAFVSVLLAVISPQSLHFSSIVMSEMPFLFCTVTCFYALYRYSTIELKKNNLQTLSWLCIIILSTASAYYLRTVGIALIFAVMSFFLFRKQWLHAGVTLGGILLLALPWWIRNNSLGIESRYFKTIMTVNPWRPEQGSISSLNEFIHKIIVNFDEAVIKGFKEILFPFIPINYHVNSTIFQIIMGFFVLAIIFYGIWNLKPIKWALLVYFIGQMGLFMLWHGGNGSRYVVPIAPFIIVCFYIGLHALITLKMKRQSKMAFYIPYAFIFMIFALYPTLKPLTTIAKSPHPAAFKNYFIVAQEMQKKIPKNTICCCRKPEFFSYFAPNICPVNYLYSTEPMAVINNLVEKKVEYVVLEQLGYSSTGRYLYPAISENQELFDLVWQLPNPDTYLLRFNREKAIKKLEVRMKEIK